MKQGTSEGSEWFHMNLRNPHWSFKINFGKYQSTSSWDLETRYSITALTMLFSTNLFLFLLQILKISSKTNEGIDTTWQSLQKFKETMIENNAFQERRSAQQKAWMWQYIQHRLVESFRQNTDLQQKHIAYEALVSEGSLNPGVAADLLLADFWGKERVRWYQKEQSLQIRLVNHCKDEVSSLAVCFQAVCTFIWWRSLTLPVSFCFQRPRVNILQLLCLYVIVKLFAIDVPSKEQLLQKRLVNPHKDEVSFLALCFQTCCTFVWWRSLTLRLRFQLPRVYFLQLLCL